MSQLPSEPMRTCICCLAIKPEDSFYVQTGNGKPHNKCKSCVSTYQREWRLQNKEALRIRFAEINRTNEARRTRQHDYKRSEQGKAARERTRQNRRAAHPEREQARFVLRNALRQGHVRKWPACAVPECEVCDGLEGHHPDYDRPLDVVWLCQTHHRQVHAELEVVQNRASINSPL